MSIQARVVAAPHPLPIIQDGQVVTVGNGDVVRMTEDQVTEAGMRIFGVFQFECPSCKAWHPLLFRLGKKRLCIYCVEWRAPKPLLKKHQPQTTMNPHRKESSS
jgi:hypothetical protein